MSFELEIEDKVISEFLKSIGPWHNHIVIGGGYALIIYKLYLANYPIGDPPVGTKDLDSLISRRIPKVSSKNIAEHLIEAGFKHFFKNYDNPATEAYVKKINGYEVEIEFLTDVAVRINKNKNVEISGVVAQPLSYLNLSLQKAIGFATFSGETGMVVSPGAWMFHKGLTFLKRSIKSKSYKDLYGIWYVSSQLGDFSDKAIAELIILGKWFKVLKQNLWEWLNEASPLEWTKLESQDPYGRLKKLIFEHLVKMILK